MDSETLKALADDNRLAIIRELAGGELCSCEISEALGISEALVSHHVKRLREAGLVRTRRVGRWQHCRLEPGRIDALAREMLALAEAARAAPEGHSDRCAVRSTCEAGEQRG